MPHQTSIIEGKNSNFRNSSQLLERKGSDQEIPNDLQELWGEAWPVCSWASNRDILLLPCLPFHCRSCKKENKATPWRLFWSKSFDTTREKRGLLSQLILSHCHHCNNNKGSHAHFLSVYYVQSKALCSEVCALKPVCFDTSAGGREKGKGTFGLGDPRKVFWEVAGHSSHNGSASVVISTSRF